MRWTPRFAGWAERPSPLAVSIHLSPALPPPLSSNPSSLPHTTLCPRLPPPPSSRAEPSGPLCWHSPVSHRYLLTWYTWYTRLSYPSSLPGRDLSFRLKHCRDDADMTSGKQFQSFTILLLKKCWRMVVLQKFFFSIRQCAQTWYWDCVWEKDLVISRSWGTVSKALAKSMMSVWEPSS